MISGSCGAVVEFAPQDLLENLKTLDIIQNDIVETTLLSSFLPFKTHSPLSPN